MSRIPSCDRSSANFAAQVSAALASDSFELLAQPILPLSSAPADPRFEILLRMRATDGTRIGLEKLIGAAACQELNRAVDRWVIEQAHRAARRVPASAARISGEVLR